MKTMNFLFTIVFALLIGACTNETQPEDLSSIDFKGSKYEENQEKEEETQEVYQLDLNQFHIRGQLVTLENKRIDLEAEIEAGNKGLIPEWESTIKLIDSNISLFNNNQKKTCSALRLRASYLEDQIANGVLWRGIELQEIREKLKQCPRKVLKVVEVMEQIIIAIKSGLPPGSCHYGPDYAGCKMPLPPEQFLVNVDEKTNEIVIKDEHGRVKGEGKFMGENVNMPGFNQYLVEMPSSMESGFIAISNDENSYEVPFNVTKDF